MLIEPKSSDAGVVVIGSFDPAIVNPDWLVLNDVIGREAASNREVSIISQTFSAFRVASFNFQVAVDRFQIIFEVAPFVELVDAACKIFGELLPHTPVRQFGINRTVHFSVGSEERRNAIGRLLAPIGPWGEWSTEWRDRLPPNRSGMVNVSVLEAIPEDPHGRRITATVQPSVMIANSAGIYTAINDHRELKDGNGAQLAALLEEQFDKSIERSEWIIGQVMKLKDAVDV